MSPAIRRGLAALTAITAVAVAAAGLQVARDGGVLGCAYVPRDRIAVLHLSPGGSRVEVRLGEGVLLRPRVLSDVTVTRSAGLAPGTQNGSRAIPDYIYAAVAIGHAALTAHTASGVAVHGEVRTTC
ncbi:MAG: hypothetical protein JWN67_5320 [Actinomycetia bacterium]|nr:hypothetical protein [Actinomycetes bacterium]